AAHIEEVAVEHFGCEQLLGAEMVGERALRRAGGRGDVAHAGAVIAGPEHFLQAGVKDGIAERGLWHGRHLIRTYVLLSSTKMDAACAPLGDTAQARWIKGLGSARGLAARDHPVAQPGADRAADEVEREHHQEEIEPIAEAAGHDPRERCRHQRGGEQRE
ncbi:hypothetical protein chiPu_0033323, partial [Chiloscyllium punctatum]|nr:hypothetical protein [Chiloscyllium punctatum]